MELVVMGGGGGVERRKGAQLGLQHALVVLHERVRGQLRGGRPVRWVVLEEKSQKVWAHLKEGKKNVRNARFGTRRYLRTEDTETVDTYRPATRAPPAAGSQRQW